MLAQKAVRAVLDLASAENRPRVIRWAGVGLVFLLANSGLLFLLVDVMGMSVPLATLLTAEIGTIARFFINHYWVFQVRDPTFRRCVEYHIANAGAFVVWWSSANVLTILGIHYLVAGVAAVGFSVLFSLMTNFFWVWGKRRVRQ